jgi:UDP-N-acetyl-2-amino-2-deoxyglucuronate dehydrogenase
MLWWIFGQLKTCKINIHTHDRAAGIFEFEKARVRWFLSINYDTLPDKLKADGKRTYRSIILDNEEVEFSQGFEELHNDSYKHIIRGRGFSIKDARPSIEIAHLVRTAESIGLKGEYHELAKKELSAHPFKKF